MGNVHKFREPILATTIVGPNGTSKAVNDLLAADLSGATPGDAILVGSTPGTFESGPAGASPAGSSTAAAGTVSETPLAVQKVSFTLDDESVEVTSVSGSLNLGTFGRNVAVMGVRSADLVGVKDGTAAIASTDIDFGIGTAVTNGVPFSGTEDNIVEKIDFNDDVLSVDMSFTSYPGESGTVVTEHPATVLADDDIIINLYLNVGTTGSLTFSGTIDFFVVDLQ